MRVNLITHTSGSPAPVKGSLPLSLTIKPACGLPGDFEFATSSSELIQLLRQQTDLPAAVLQRFENKMWDPTGARLLGVDLSDRVLTDIGYFID